MSDETQTVEPSSLTISGMPFQVVPRFSAGHVLKANEASALNQTLFENLRNNFAGKIAAHKKAAEAGEAEMPSLETLQAELDAYAAIYEFGERKASSPRVSRDPLEERLHKLATTRIREELVRLGYKLREVPSEQIAGLVKNLIEHPTHGPAYRALAEKQLADERALIGLDMAGLAPAAPAPQEAAAA